MESLGEILERMGDPPRPAATIGKHPRYDEWPDEVKFPVIDGVEWMLCTDGCYFVRLDGLGMLVPVRHHCWRRVRTFHDGVPVDDICGAPIHPADVAWKVALSGELRTARCRVHRAK